MLIRSVMTQGRGQLSDKQYEQVPKDPIFIKMGLY